MESVNSDMTNFKLSCLVINLLARKDLNQALKLNQKYVFDFIQLNFYSSVEYTHRRYQNSLYFF